MGFLLREPGGSVCWSPIDGTSCPHRSEGVGVISHINGDVLGGDLYTVVPYVEGDEARQDVAPELIRKSRRACLMIGVWCSRSVSSSASACCLSSAVSSPSNAYLHSSPRFAHTFRSVFCSLKCSGFLTLSAGSGCVDSSEDVVDEDLMRSTNVCHDIGASWWWDGEWVAFALVDGLVACSAFVGVSSAAEVEVSKPTQVVEVVAASVTAVAVRSSLSAAVAVGMASSVAVAIGRGSSRPFPQDGIAACQHCLFSSCLTWAWRSCSRANSVTSFVILASLNLSTWVQVNPYGLGAVWRQPGRFRSGEVNAGLCDCMEDGYRCYVELKCEGLRGGHEERG